MRPTFTKEYFPDYSTLLETLKLEVEWDVRAGNRRESFMAFDTRLTYSYGEGKGSRVYTASPMHTIVRDMTVYINGREGTEYNICVLNYYDDERNHLGWHADDSPEQDPSHPICVVSFGASRYIWVRENGQKGNPAPEDMFLLTPGSMFVMPPGFQDTHQHKIPKHSGKCGPRVSMTFRKLDR